MKYFKLVTHIYCFFLWKNLLKNLKGEMGDSFRSKYKILSDDGDIKINPEFGKHITMLIPLTPSIINSNIVQQYCSDHSSAIDMIMYEARIASYIDKSQKEVYTEETSSESPSILMKIEWKYKYKYLIISLMVWVGILSVLLFLILLLL